MASRRIDDHASWVGAAPKGQVFPEGAKVKSYSSAEGTGGISDYPDTTEAIERDQRGGDKKTRSQPMKTGYRF